MFNKFFASILATSLSLAAATSFAAQGDKDVSDQAPAPKVQVEDGKTHYWSHPRLGMVKVDATGRMLTGRSTGDEGAVRSAPSGPPSTRTR